MTTTEITWGDPIDAANDGKPLPWLKEDEKVLCNWLTEWEGPYHVDCITGWTEGFQIKLPASHPYYLAVARGFTYWPGGASAPDADEILLRDGSVHAVGCSSWRWTHGNGCDDVDIIGYRRRTDTSDDYVRVKRMTLVECEACAYDYHTLSALGLIREETPLEQFEREHGGLDNNQRDIIEAFIAWQSRNG